MPEILGINTIYILFYLMIGCTIALVASIFNILKAYKQDELEAKLFFDTIMDAIVLCLFYPIPLCLLVIFELFIFIADFFEKIFSFSKKKK